MPTELLASAPAAAYLLQHIPLALLNAGVDKLVDLTNGLAVALGAQSQVQLEKGSELSETVDCLDLLLESALSSGALKLDVITPAAERPHDMRVIAKQIMKMRLSVGVANKVENAESRDEAKPQAGQAALRVAPTTQKAFCSSRRAGPRTRCLSARTSPSPKAIASESSTKSPEMDEWSAKKTRGVRTAGGSFGARRV